MSEFRAQLAPQAGRLHFANLVILASVLTLTAAHAQVFVAPYGMAGVEGNGRVNSAPFNNVSRFQQIYAASEFGFLAGPRLIRQIAFRPDSSQSSAFNHTFTNIQFRLSTTATSVDALSADFAGNVGTNETIVFDGSLTFTSSNLVVWGNAKQFDLIVNLSTPFFYDPKGGNLLLEIRNFSNGFTGYIDGNTDGSADPGIRMNWLDNSATGTTGTVQGFGLLTRFSFENGIPPAGPVVPELAALDQAMTNYMAGHAFDAGTLSLMKDSKLVLRQAYGWRDTNLTASAHPDNLFRLASVSKTITGCAIQKLISAGVISAGTKIYSYLGIQPWGGVLGDNRITNITVQNLLDHAGGWNRDISPVGDPVFNTIQISSEMGLGYPAAASNVISWMFSKPLDFAPGTSSAYSNFGYGILGRVVEKAGGKSYINYIRQDLFGPYGITNIIQCRSRPRDLDPWEIWYDDWPYLYPSAVDYPTNLQVRWADGGGYFESFDAFGGLSASAPALCRYMLNYWLAGAHRVPASSYGWTYIFYGSLPGTTTVIHQAITQNASSTNGLEFAALFNARTGANDNDEAHTAIVNAATSISSWPASGGGAIQWSVAATNIDKNAASIIVPLVRSGLSTLPVKVSYMTYSKTATTNNYVPAAGIVSFAAGETSKNVIVAILNDGHIEPTRLFSLELISASGGAWLADRVTCAVNVLDNSTPPRFTGQSVLAGGAFTTQITGATGLIVRVDFSTNFLNWQPLETFTNSSGSRTITDIDASTRPGSFYRAVTQ